MAELLRIADLNPKKPFRFEITPDAQTLALIASDLGLSALRKMRFTGELSASGKSDWELTGKIGATVVQPCVVTLDPVTTRVDEPVLRRYLADWDDPEDTEVEMTMDDAADPLPVTLNLLDIATEALALSIPQFPRTNDAELGEITVTEPGAEALTNETAKPFAGLADLKKKLEER